MKTSEKVRICVIGAGPSGLGVLRALQTLDESKYDRICYERYDNIGGIWNFRGKEGIEEDGIEVHTGQYYNLISNGPKHCLEIPDYLFPVKDPDLTGYQCFPDRVYHLKYLTGFADKYNLQRYIQFQTWVDWVAYDEATKKFQVTLKNLKQEKLDEKSVELFDYVIVATGHFNYPNYVTYPGQETFPGLLIHSKQILDFYRFKGKKVLAIGSSYSAEECAIKGMEAGAERVTLSFRSKSRGFKWPKGVDERPIVEKIEGSTVYFADGTSAEYDVIILCTGWVHHFPFLEDKLRLKTRNRLAPPLYKQVVFPENPALMYIGMQDQFYSHSMFWLHGHFCAKVICGAIKMPSKDQMYEEISKDQQEEDTLKTQDEKIDFQTKHVNELSELTGQVKIDVAALYKKWEKDRERDIKTYKHQVDYKSVHR